MLLEFFGVACELIRTIALGIHVRSKQDPLSVGGPHLPARFGRNRSQPAQRGHLSYRAIEICDPDLRPAFFRRDERKALPIRRPARAVTILIGDDFALLTSR